MSQPVNGTEELIGPLFALWSLLQGIEGIRKLAPVTSRKTKELLPRIKAIAQDALPRAIEICQEVDAAIEKMKPLGAS